MVKNVMPPEHEFISCIPSSEKVLVAYLNEDGFIDYCVSNTVCGKWMCVPGEALEWSEIKNKRVDNYNANIKKQLNNG